MVWRTAWLSTLRLQTACNLYTALGNYYTPKPNSYGKVPFWRFQAIQEEKPGTGGGMSYVNTIWWSENDSATKIVHVSKLKPPAVPDIS